MNERNPFQIANIYIYIYIYAYHTLNENIIHGYSEYIDKHEHVQCTCKIDQRYLPLDHIISIIFSLIFADSIIPI